MFTLAYEMFPENPCFTFLPETLISIYFLANEKDFDSVELRNLPQLRESVWFYLSLITNSILACQFFDNFVKQPQIPGKR